MTLHLDYQAASSVPVEVEGVTPEHLLDKSLAEIERLEIFQGNRKQPLGEFFRVSGDPSDARVEWSGDLSGVHWIGAKMSRGQIRICGDAGRHVGADMTGGEILAEGNVGDWLGGEMQAGKIHVQGNAGHLVGAAYRGAPRGMAGGVILVGGDAGNEIGHTMRRGLVAVGGKIGDLAGFNMLAGTILVLGESGIRHGAGMRRGTLAFLGDQPPPLLPSFRRACRFQPLAAKLLFRSLKKHGFAFPETLMQADIELHHGDLIEGGRGEIWLKA